MTQPDSRDAGPQGDVGRSWANRLLEFLSRPEVIKAMQDASDEGLTAAGSVGDQLLRTFGAEVWQPRLGELAGRLIQQVMEAHGYRHLSEGCTAQKNPVFVKASRFARQTT